MSRRTNDPLAADADPVEVTQQDETHIVASLLGGPITWGLIGAGADALLDSGRLFTAIGIVVGFVTSLYVVFVRYGR